MIVEHIKVSDLETRKWSGGTTTQLAIYPKDAEYIKRNFLFRISTATVEAEESSFTKLPGVSRKIMILDGEIKIEHQNHYLKILKKFEQDSFEGDWDTKSVGKATDFNLMTTESTVGKIEAITIKGKNDKLVKSNSFYTGIYIFNGHINLIIEGNSFQLSKGDFFNILDQKSETVIKINATMSSEIILTKIDLH